MSVPPQLIRVKRKATEEAPVSFLRVQENKRHRGDAFVYRLQEDAPFADIPLPVQKPIIHTSGPGYDGNTFQGQRIKNTPTSKGKHDSVESAPPVGPASLASASAAASTTTNSAGHAPAPKPEPEPEPRRFHMSRRDMILAASNHPSHHAHGGISKKRTAPALFIERKIKRLPSKKLESLTHSLDAPSSPPSSRVPDTYSSPASVSLPEPEQMEVDAVESRKFKKPGVAKLTQKNIAPKPKAEFPPTMVNRWNVDLDKLTADMNAFAMEQIGMNIQQAEQEKQQQQEKSASRAQPVLKASPSRFKPKAPAKRYAERHPEVAQNSVDEDMKDASADVSDTDDDDYIIETYIRVPASTIEKHHVPPQKVGLLVFDADPDLEFFYGDGSDSDDEWAEDQEDENAENYYTADYPDEEVASDDEFGYNAYAYRNGNASDLEEYGVTDDSDSSPIDDSDGKVRFKSKAGKMVE